MQKFKTMKTIGDAIKQKQFQSEQQKAHINLTYTASQLNLQANAAMKAFELTLPQFNILRILRGMHPNPGSVKELTNRMIDQSSNASRLVDKLLAKKWVERKNCPEDRRQVNIKITDTGLKQVEKASEGLEKLGDNVFSNLTKEELLLLNNLLDKIRN